MPEGTTTNKVVQLKDPTTKEPVSPVVNVGSIYDKNGNKVDNLLSYVVAGTDVPIPEISDIADNLQQQVDAKLDEVDTAIESIDTAINNMEDQVDEFLTNPGLPIHDVRTYPVREGQSISAGDVVNVGRETLSGGTYGQLSIGEVLSLPINGVQTDFIVVHQGNPDSSIYDSSCDGTWLMIKNIPTTRKAPANTNSFSNTVFHTYEENCYEQFDSSVKSAIKQVKIPYRPQGGITETVSTLGNGLECHCFSLSAFEMANISTVAGNNRFAKDGAKLDYFDGKSDSEVDTKRIATYNGNANEYYLRTGYIFSDVNSSATRVTTSGTI